MSGKHQQHGDPQGLVVSISPLAPTDVPEESIAGFILRPNLDTWAVEIHNRDTGEVLHATCHAISIEDVEGHALSALFEEMNDRHGRCEVDIRRLRGVRKLWNVAPGEPPDIGVVNKTETANPCEPPLIGRVVAVDADEAARIARTVYALEGRGFCICQA